MTAWYYATCARGMEELLADEVRLHDPAEVSLRAGGVSFRGDTRCAYGVALWSRVAGRVMHELMRARLKNADDLYKRVQEVDWSQYLAPGQTLAVRGIGRGPFFDNTHFAALRVKDAIVDQLRERGRPDVDIEDPDLPLRVHFDGPVATLLRDLAGGSLHKRGYRTALHRSPLNEALAAGLLMLSDWDRKSPLCDPLCGSGTFLIEAGWITGDRAPALGRDLRMQRWPDFDKPVWDALQKDAEARWQVGRAHIPLLEGNDNHPDALQLGKDDAERAGVPVTWSGHHVGDFEMQARFVVTNPPYGERLAVGPVWSGLGEMLKRHSGTVAWVLSGEPENTRGLKMKTDRRIPVKNGGIDCRWLRYAVR